MCEITMNILIIHMCLILHWILLSCWPQLYLKTATLQSSSLQNITFCFHLISFCLYIIRKVKWTWLRFTYHPLHLYSPIYTNNLESGNNDFEQNFTITFIFFICFAEYVCSHSFTLWYVFPCEEPKPESQHKKKA